MKFNLYARKKDPTEVDHKLEMSNSNVKDVMMEIPKQNKIQHVEEPVQLRKPSGLFSLNGHAVSISTGISILIWLFILTMRRLAHAIKFTEMRQELTGLYRPNDDDFFQRDLQLSPVIQVLLGITVALVNYQMFCNSFSKRSKSMYFIFGAIGIVFAIRGFPLIFRTTDKFSKLTTKLELLRLFKKNLPHSCKDFYFEFLQPFAIFGAMTACDCYIMLKFWSCLGVDECPHCGRDPEVSKDRPRQKFSNWDWSLFLMVLGLGGSIIPFVLVGTVPSLLALKSFGAGVMFLIMFSNCYRHLDFYRKMKIHKKKQKLIDTPIYTLAVS